MDRWEWVNLCTLPVIFGQIVIVLLQLQARFERWTIERRRLRVAARLEPGPITRD